MLNAAEAGLEIKKYLKKLNYMINNEGIFTLINVRIMDKKKIDDLLCCIEASWPEEYKSYIQQNIGRKLQSQLSYEKLLLAIKNKFLFSTDVYAVRFKDAPNAIATMASTIDADINFVVNNTYMG